MENHWDKFIIQCGLLHTLSLINVNEYYLSVGNVSNKDSMEHMGKDRKHRTNKEPAWLIPTEKS